MTPLSGAIAFKRVLQDPFDPRIVKLARAHPLSENCYAKKISSLLNKLEVFLAIILQSPISDFNQTTGYWIRCVPSHIIPPQKILECGNTKNIFNADQDKFIFISLILNALFTKNINPTHLILPDDLYQKLLQLHRLNQHLKLLISSRNFPILTFNNFYKITTSVNQRNSYPSVYSNIKISKSEGHFTSDKLSKISLSVIQVFVNSNSREYHKSTGEIILDSSIQSAKSGKIQKKITYSPNRFLSFLRFFLDCLFFSSLMHRARAGNLDLASLGNSGITITGTGTNSQTGSSVSNAGDVNGDGKDDMLIGAYGYSSNTGRVYLVYGSSNLTNIDLASLGSSGISITGVASSRAGYSVSNAGDINGDGKADILIGAYSYSSNTGRVYLIYGSANLTNIDLASLGNNGIIITGVANAAGWSVSNAGDVNGDGKADILIGAPGYSSNTGIVYLVYGSANLTNIDLASLGNNGITMTGVANSYTGVSVNNAGDVNGDGKDDMLIGAYTYSSNKGKVFLVYGNASLTNINLASLGSSGITITGASTTSQTGYSVSCAGDVNGDGKTDMLIGAYGYSSSAGRTYLIYGSANLTDINLASLGSSGITITGVASSRAGYSVSNAGDVNGDGKADILIGAYGYSSYTGRVYLIYGSSSLTDINLTSLGNNGITITGVASSYTGWSVSNAGDVNGDGKTDMLIGAPGYSSSVGRAYLVYGAASGFITSAPTAAPTSQPSRQPSGRPSTQPSNQPISRPTSQPSGQPTNQPSGEPTNQPSKKPSRQPSGRPSTQPSNQPISRPTSQPSGQPVNQPSGDPTNQPSKKPSRQPSGRPSTQPSNQPISRPTSQPSGQPTNQPTSQPTALPSGQSEANPTSQPSRQPSLQPVSRPSSQPSTTPSRQPQGKPTSQPTKKPSLQPVSRPSSQPTTLPSGQPLANPTSQPSRQPSLRPVSRPSSQPTALPSVQPQEKPTSQPTALPSGQPHITPSTQPTSQPSRHPYLRTNSPSLLSSKTPTIYPTVSQAPTPLPPLDWTAVLDFMTFINSVVISNKKTIACGGNSPAFCYQFNNGGAGALSAAFRLPWDLSKSLFAIDDDIVVTGFKKTSLTNTIARLNSDRMMWGYDIAIDGQIDVTNFNQGTSQIVSMGYDPLTGMFAISFDPVTGKIVWKVAYKSLTQFHPQAMGSLTDLLNPTYVGGYAINKALNNKLFMTTTIYSGSPQFFVTLGVQDSIIQNQQDLVNSVVVDPNSKIPFVAGGISLNQENMTSYIFQAKQSDLTQGVEWGIRLIGGVNKIKKHLLVNDTLFALAEVSGFAPQPDQSDLVLFKIDPINRNILAAKGITGPKNISSYSLAIDNSGLRIASDTDDPQALLFYADTATLQFGSLPPDYSSYDAKTRFNCHPINFTVENVQRPQWIVYPAVANPISPFNLSSEFVKQLYPDNFPSINPTESPTLSPTIRQTNNPSVEPSIGNPTSSPSTSPTGAPTFTFHPTGTPAPTEIPTEDPSPAPSEIPTIQPTFIPTYTKTFLPTSLNTFLDTPLATAGSSLTSTRIYRRPSLGPIASPSSQPSGSPSVISVASDHPSLKPLYALVALVALYIFKQIWDNRQSIREKYSKVIRPVNNQTKVAPKEESLTIVGIINQQGKVISYNYDSESDDHSSMFDYKSKDHSIESDYKSDDSSLVEKQALDYKEDAPRIIYNKTPYDSNESDDLDAWILDDHSEGNDYKSCP